MTRLGDRVRATAVSWGDGTVIELRDDPDLKPIVVRADDGRVGHFDHDQIDVVWDPRDVLNTCNACEAAPMVPGDPRGYCAACGAEADSEADR